MLGVPFKDRCRGCFWKGPAKPFQISPHRYSGGNGHHASIRIIARPAEIFQCHLGGNTFEKPVRQRVHHPRDLMRAGNDHQRGIFYQRGEQMHPVRIRICLYRQHHPQQNPNQAQRTVCGPLKINMPAYRMIMRFT